MSALRLPIVGVMGSGREPHRERAQAVGRWLAQEGVHLLTGGGGGVMAAVSQAFCETSGRRGLVLGIIPGSDDGGRGKPGYPNEWVEVPVYTHLTRSGKSGTVVGSRNHINVLTSDVVIALPGSHGTSSEVALALQYGRPVVCYLGSRDEIPDLPDEVPVIGDLEGLQAFVRAQLGRSE